MTPGKAKGTRCDRDLSAYQTSCTEAVYSGLNELNSLILQITLNGSFGFSLHKHPDFRAFWSHF